MHEGKYLYGFIEGCLPEQLSIMGMGNYGKVYFISYSSISAIISDTPLIQYDPSRKNVMIHADIINQLIKGYDLVPCNFGNVFKCKEDVITFMEKTYKYILANLKKTEGKIEVGLRMLWKKHAFLEEVETKEINKYNNLANTYNSYDLNMFY